MNLEIVNPLQIPDWDDLVLATGKASFFHSSSWARVLKESYGYKPVYFASLENGRLCSLMPFMEIDSWLTGKRGVSLPFTDQCRFLGVHENISFDMILPVIDYGRMAGWKYVEWRNGEPLPDGRTALAKFHIHVLGLEKTLGRIFHGFRSSTQRNIRRAERGGLRADVQRSSLALKEFYGLHCMTRKSHSLPPQPYQFFEKLLEHVIGADNGFVVLAAFEKTPVAGAVFFHFGDTVLFKYGASDKRYHHLRPNNLVMWEAIKWCKERSFKYLDFGRTKPDHKGLLQFKAGWGTENQLISYYKYDLRKTDFVDKEPKWESAVGFAGKLPGPVLNLVGNLFYRHVG